MKCGWQGEGQGSCAELGVVGQAKVPGGLWCSP